MARPLPGSVPRTRSTAASSVPNHPFGCKRSIIDQGYYETFEPQQRHAGRPAQGRDPRGDTDRHRHRAGVPTTIDAIIYATGFDAMTGALTCIDVRGRNGVSVAGILGYRRPAVVPRLGRGRISEPVHRAGTGKPLGDNEFRGRSLSSTWSGSATASIIFANTRIGAIEALPEAQTRPDAEHTTALVASTVLVHPTCNSWYNGGNVPGKRRMYMAYAAGISGIPPALQRDRRRRATPGSSSGSAVNALKEFGGVVPRAVAGLRSSDWTPTSRARPASVGRGGARPTRAERDVAHRREHRSGSAAVGLVCLCGARVVGAGSRRRPCRSATVARPAGAPSPTRATRVRTSGAVRP